MTLWASTDLNPIGVQALIAIMLGIASAWGFLGTHAQANLAREEIASGSDPDVARAALLWPVGPKLRPKRRLAHIDAAEAVFRNEPERWDHYVHQCRVVEAWNTLQSATAIAFVASFIAMVSAIV